MARDQGDPLNRCLAVVRAGALTPELRAQPARWSVARIAVTLASALVAVGLFSMSWDLLFNGRVGPYNVKLPAIAFTLAFIASIPLLPHVSVVVGRGGLRSIRAVAVIVIAIVVLLIVRSLALPQPASGLSQVVAVLTGAVFPAAAILAIVRSELDVRWALNWVIAGGYLASAFGVYQLIAFYSHLPQFIDYTGVGTGGGVGRIAAFSYEPAYFAYFLTIVAGAVIAKSVIRGVQVPWHSILIVGVLLYLANVRALLFLLPFAAILLATSWRVHRRVLVRSIVFAVLLVVGTYAVPAGTAAVTNLGSSASTPSVDASQGRTTPKPEQTSDAPGAPTPSTVPDPNQISSPGNVLDPNEQSSNAPRLALYRAVLGVDVANLAVGVGPGQLKRALAESGYLAPNQGSQVVANNVWLQAVADGGVLLLALEVAFVVLLVIGLFRFRRSPAQPLIAATLAVLFVGGMLTSYFFDLKVWVALGLIGAIVISESARGRVLKASQPPAAAK